MRDCTTIAVRGKEGKQVNPSVQINVSPMKNCFYELLVRGSKTDYDYYDIKLYFILLIVMSSFYVG